VSGSTSLLGQFTVSTQSVVSFTVTTTEPLVQLYFEIYSTSSCTPAKFTFTCTWAQNPCIAVSPLLDAGSYYFVGRDDIVTGIPAPNYNFTVIYIEGNSGCRNITNELSTCANYISTSDTYNINFGSVPTYEAQATVAYNTLSASWSSACNNSTWKYACSSVFQPRLCTSTGALTQTLLCKTDCLNTLQYACLPPNESPNLCESAACTNVANSIGGCNVPPPPRSPSTGGRLALSLSFTIISLYLLSIIN